MRKTALFYLITFLSPATQASALYFYEIGTEDAALAGAGRCTCSGRVHNRDQPGGHDAASRSYVYRGLQAMDGDISYDG